MSRFWSRTVKNITPYVPGEQPRDRKYIKLNTNENPYPPSPKAIEAIIAAANDSLRLYPTPRAVHSATQSPKPSTSKVTTSLPATAPMSFWPFVFPLFSSRPAGRFFLPMSPTAFIRFMPNSFTHHTN